MTSTHQIANRMRHLFEGQTIARILMNESFTCKTLRGKVVDVGGGRNPDYFNYFKKESAVNIESLDASLSRIDFEYDALPYVSGTVDTVIVCNVLEHIYNHQFLLRETARILGTNGTLVGFVPFWVGYHPDPHDYFRYTHEALVRMLDEAGFVEINIDTVGGGPIMANFNTIVLSVPRIVRPLLYLLYAPLDRIFLILRPKSAKRNPLGFVFTAHA